MWIGRKQWQELRGQWQQLRQHIITTNHELGLVQRDVKWLKWLICAVFLGVALGLARQFLGI